MITLHFAGCLLLACTAAYVLLCLVALRRPRRDGTGPMLHESITVLKPLHGAEPRLYENLRSFCEQDHQQYQIVFGTREADDPALAVARRLQAEFPQIDISIISDARQHGLNPKVSNLINMLAHARHDWLVLADSDIAVEPDYLRRVCAPLARPEVGLVTCLYHGRPLGGFWSQLGSQFINGWFRPSVRLAQFFGAEQFGFGATMALRRDALNAIGGLPSLVNTVADDYYLGLKIAEQGLSTVLSDHEVVTDVVETSLGELVAHELRWFRTIRAVRTGSYLGTGVCFTLPIVLTGLALARFDALACLLGGIATLARLRLFLLTQPPRTGWREQWLGLAAFLLRDSLSLLLWAWAFSSGKVRWRGQQMNIDSAASAHISS